MFRAIALTGFTLCLALPASAFDHIAGFRDWAVYQDRVNGETVCYATSKASDKAPKSVTHGDVVFFVTYFQGSNQPQNSIRVAYDLREDVQGEITVGRKRWKMYAVKKESFAHDDDERRITSAIRKGSELRVESTSARNTEVAYHFSLSGSADAVDKARELCS